MSSETESVPCIVEIRRNSDGVVRHDKSHEFYGDYQWADGNYSCDCNRCLFFCRAGDPPENEDHCQCGEDGYSVRILGADGKVLYEDDSWETK